MNAEAAWMELTTRKLVFGDDAQIAARKFLEAVQLAEEAYRKCDERHPATQGFVKGCLCIAEWSNEVREELSVIIQGADECWCCNGSGEHECGAECHECDGEGVIGRKPFAWKELVAA